MNGAGAGRRRRWAPERGAGSARDRAAVWLGAGALSVFLLLTIAIVHRFWSLPEPRATLSLYFALEHVSIIGGLLAAAIASHLRRQLGG